MMRTVKIGTRGSALALVQAKMTAEKIENADKSVKAELVIVKTQGDKNQTSPLDTFGGKAVFVDEFEQMLLDGEIDIAVHSAKDMPTSLPQGLEIGAVLERADVRDVLVYKKSTKEIKTIGTSSKRRTAQILALYKNSVCLPLRGNVPTRVQKMKDGLYDAVVLAKAGLDRLGIFGVDNELEYKILPIDDIVPAACQGIIAIENRQNDNELKQILGKINDEKTAVCLDHERQIMTLLDASCVECVGAVEIEKNVIVMKKINNELRYKNYDNFDLKQIEKDFM